MIFSLPTLVVLVSLYFVGGIEGENGKRERKGGVAFFLRSVFSCVGLYH